MFNVIRPAAVPASLAKNQYNHKDVVEILKPMFFEKCYLCERNDIQDVEVEHFEPHMSVKALKFDWKNLFYSCSRCNSLKSSIHKNLIDCSNSSVNAFSEIVCKMPSAPNDDITVEPSSTNPSIQVSNTVTLLRECYNSTNTALRGVSREALIEQLYYYNVKFITARMTLKDPSEGKGEKHKAEERLEAMLCIEHPFSAFWRWQYINDGFLTAKYSKLRTNF